MEAQPQVPQPKKSNKIFLIIGVILLACCCLVVIAIAVYQLVIAPKISNTFDTINDTLQYTEVPSGGLTDDTLRRDIWIAIGGASLGLGCTPDATQTTIEVTQDPDASGVWVEKWTVACSSGGQKAFDVTLTPTAGGGTDYNITTSP
jgi:hypothetical protein